MALMDESVWRGKIYSGGWVGGDLGTGLDAPVIEPATGQEIGRTGIATPADVARAAQIAAAAQPAWAATPHTERSAILRRAGGHLAGPRGRHRMVGDQGERQDPAGHAVRDARRHPGDLRGGHAALAGLRRTAAERAAAAELRRAGPGRGHRRHRAVQLPADPGHPLGRARAGAGQRGGAQAGPAHGRVRRCRAGPGLRGGRAARRAAARAARRGGRRRGGRHRPGHQADLLHRLHRRRAPGRRAGRAACSSGLTWSWAATRR